MDISTILGFVSGVTFIILSLIISGANFATYLDPASFMITVGGATAAVLIATPMERVILAMKAVKFTFKSTDSDTSSVINKIIELANIARKEGLLALEEAAQNMDDEFLKKGILLIVDGTDPELVRSILETELAFIENRHADLQGVWIFYAGQGPAWGMIGTLLGLVNMLENMSDVSSLGGNMAIALITTLYGSLLANLICSPIANKLKIRSAEEIMVKEVMIEGMLSIQAGENPRIIEEKLKAFLSPAIRKTTSEASEEGGE